MGKLEFVQRAGSVFAGRNRHDGVRHRVYGQQNANVFVLVHVGFVEQQRLQSYGGVHQRRSGIRQRLRQLRQTETHVFGRQVGFVGLQRTGM